MKLDDILKNVSESIPAVDASLESRIYHQAIGNKQVRSHRNIRLALMIFILAGFALVLFIKKPYKNSYSYLSIIVYSKSDAGYYSESLEKENAAFLGEYTFPMDVLPGLPMTFNCYNSLLAISVDNGEFALWHDYEITQEDDGFAVFTPTQGEKKGLEYVGNNYLIEGSSTIYWVPHESEHNATIIYKIIQNREEISAGKIIITNENGIYKATLKQD